jgi:hypothetical protein
MSDSKRVPLARALLDTILLILIDYLYATDVRALRTTQVISAALIAPHLIECK